MISKEDILKSLEQMEWNKELHNMLQCLVAKYVVYQVSPNDGYRYCAKYYVNEENARQDFASRSYVPDGRWCICEMAQIKNDDREVLAHREIYDNLMD